MLTDRRSFLTATTAGALVLGCGRHDADAGGDDEVTPVEDLMREHGVLRRVMYLYDDAIVRLDAHRDVPLDALAAGAGMIRRVIEDYHEKLEEDLVFPRFEKAGKLADLCAVLRRQHQTGRQITDRILALAKASLADADRAELATALHSFNHLYRPHAAREDTVLFPALRALVGKHQYAELGDTFEDREKQAIGDHGFERAVADVARLEDAFGLGDLAKIGT